jgi:ribosome-associated toxin RatA of RatAB toxin-antitoxin module
MILRRLRERFLKIQYKLLQGVKYSKEGTFNALPLTVFDCIKNTQNYSQFIPWCSRSSIAKTISAAENFTELTITFQKVK